MRPATSWYESNFPYTIEISLPTADRMTCICQWCDKYVSEELVSWLYYVNYITSQYLQYHICFSNAEDASMFILAHGGKIIGC